MKKLFIGCGIVVLLILGFLGYITYQIYPDVKEWQAQWQGAFERIQVLETSYPFDPQAQTQLDTQRFARMLDMRAELSDYLSGVGEKMDALAGAKRDGKDIGFVEMLRGLFKTATPLLPEFAARLDQAQMSWREFAWYTRLMWACLYRVDAGVGPPELEPLRGSYARLSSAYDQIQHDNKNLPPLSELIGTFPPGLISEANTVLMQDIGRVERGVHIVAADHLYMQPVSRLEDLDHLQVADPARAPAATTPDAVKLPPVQPVPVPKADASAEPDKPGDK